MSADSFLKELESQVAQLEKTIGDPMATAVKLSKLQAASQIASALIIVGYERSEVVPNAIEVMENLYKAVEVEYEIIGASGEIDREYKRYSPEALQQWADKSIGTPVKMHGIQVGTVIDAKVTEGKVVQKVYMPIRPGVQEFVDFMNEMFESDPRLVERLVESRYECNAKIALHPTIQAWEHPEELDSNGDPTYSVRFVGILNGFFGIHDKGRRTGGGAICSIHDDETGKLQGFKVLDAD